MNIALFLPEEKWHLVESGDFIELKKTLGETVFFEKISFFPDPSFWELDSRFEKIPHEKYIFDDVLKFEGWTFKKSAEIFGKDENGLNFCWVEYGDLLYLEIGSIPSLGISGQTFILKTIY